MAQTLLRPSVSKGSLSSARWSWRSEPGSVLSSNIPFEIGAGDIRGDQPGRVFRVADQLQGVPMLYSHSVGVHFVDIDTGDSRVLRVIVEQIQKIHVCPHIFADCNDAVYGEQFTT